MLLIRTATVCSRRLIASQTAGYAVYSPNYRGSVGWGLEFAEANWEDCGGADWQDMCVRPLTIITFAV